MSTSQTPDFAKALATLPVPFDVLTQCLQRETQPLSEPNGSTSTSKHADPDQDSAHKWSAPELMAVAQAWASARPLLVRGEAGCGKSQLAKALAKSLNVPLFHETVHPRFEATDLLYRLDHVKRLAKAQLLSASVKGGGSTNEWVLRRRLDSELSEARFVERGVLLRAYECEPHKGGSTGRDQERRQHHLWPRAVVLIDEIDKADAEVPNALLQVLGDRSITVPGRSGTVHCEKHRPLILITTNEDRELPAAFTRRCAVLNILPPKDEAGFTQWLLTRAQAHPKLLDFGGAEGTLLASAAKQVWQDRQDAENDQLPTVGLAEYIDLLYALFNISHGDAAKADRLLGALAPFALKKHKAQNQIGKAESSKDT
jgi:MoxR-like ATPase